MTRQRWVQVGIAAVALAALLLAFWQWRQGAMVLLLQGMMLC